MHTSPVPPTAPAAPQSATFEDFAVGHYKRRSFLVVFTLPGLTVAGAGAVWLLVSAALREDIESGLIMTGLGLGMAGVAWLATLGMRFTRKPPRAIRWTDLMESAASTTLIAWATVTALAVVGGAALVLFAPLGREPGRIALMSSIVAYPTCLLGGLLYIRSLKRRRNEIYARWLTKLNR